MTLGPGPIFVLLGASYLPVLVLFFFAKLGTFVYGKAQKTTSTLASNWMARIEILTKCRYFCIFACIYN
jgi:hypothetical protein